MMNLSSVPPLGVKIMTEDQPMVAGREYSLKCVSWGSLPPAEISWYRRQTYGAKVPRFNLVIIRVLQITCLASCRYDGKGRAFWDSVSCDGIRISFNLTMSCQQQYLKAELNEFYSEIQVQSNLEDSPTFKSLSFQKYFVSTKINFTAC